MKQKETFLHNITLPAKIPEIMLHNIMASMPEGLINYNTILVYIFCGTMHLIVVISYDSSHHIVLYQFCC